MEDKKRRQRLVPFPFFLFLLWIGLVGSDSWALECQSLGRADFVGAFDYQWTESTQSLKLRLKGNEARIENDSGSCQAECRVSHWVRTENKTPISAELQCRSPGFSALASTITLHWGQMVGAQPKLRIGKFLDPQDETPLRVERDLLSAESTVAQTKLQDLVRGRHPSSD